MSAEPDPALATRSALDIFWGCLFVIFACTWTVQHLNVPEQREGRFPGWTGAIRWAFKRGWGTTKWMLVTLIAPEYVVMKDALSLSAGKRHLKELQNCALADGVPWTITHSLFANMGGFVIRTYEPQRLANTTAWSKEISAMKVSTDTITTSQDGIELREFPELEADNTGKSQIFTLLAHEILELRRTGLLSVLPYVSQEEILDKSKSDWFVRVIAMSQISWLVVQTIARACYHLAISHLEIATIAFASCALVIYILNWEKPKSVGVPWTLASFAGPLPEAIQNIVNVSHRKNFLILDFSELIYIDNIVASSSTEPLLVSNVFAPIDDSSAEILSIFISSVIFGGIHLCAIGFQFPSQVERILWIVSSAFCTSAFILFAFLALIARSLEDHVSESIKRIMIKRETENLVSVIMLALYILCRLFLLVEMFRLLFFLPPSALVATWASFIPHVS